MSKALRNYWKQLFRFFQLDSKARQQYLHDPVRAFTRKRMLPFQHTACLVLWQLKKSLALELFDFFRLLDLPFPTKSAFVQARQKIRPSFFAAFFTHTVRLYYRCFKAHRWEGFRLWACDGTGLRLPDEPDLGDRFGWHKNQYSQVPSTRILCWFDVLNELITSIQLHDRHSGELTVMLPLVRKVPRDVLMIYDRAFGSYALAWLHQHYASHCIIRLIRTFNPIVVDFLASGKRQQIVQAPMAERSVRALRGLGFQVSRADTIRYRLIRVDLPGGEAEVLLTTLIHPLKWPAREFARLYARRWGVETCFHVLKSYFQAASFCSYTTEGVEQELWAMFALYNIQTASQRPLVRKVKSTSRRRKYAYKLNRNVGLGYLRRMLPDLLLHPLKQLGERLDRLLSLLGRALEPVRPNKNRVRTRRFMRGTERHMYEPNYRSCF